MRKISLIGVMALFVILLSSQALAGANSISGRSDYVGLYSYDNEWRAYYRDGNRGTLHIASSPLNYFGDTFSTEDRALSFARLKSSDGMYDKPFRTLVVNANDPYQYKCDRYYGVYSCHKVVTLTRVLVP